MAAILSWRRWVKNEGADTALSLRVHFHQPVGILVNFVYWMHDIENMKASH